jgi:hypothetical protein
VWIRRDEALDVGTEFAKCSSALDNAATPSHAFVALDRVACFPVLRSERRLESAEWYLDASYPGQRLCWTRHERHLVNIADLDQRDTRRDVGD